MGSKLKPYLLAMVALFIATATPLQAQNGTITGAVTDSESGRPVTAATIEITGADGRIAAVATTTNDGNYVASVPAGTYSLTVRHIAFELARVANVNVTANGTTRTDVAMRVSPFTLAGLTVTATPGITQEAAESPAHVETVSDEDIKATLAVTPATALRRVAGVDIVQQGVQSSNVVVRGFNNIFSGALLTLSDYRLAGVPSLRVNLLHFIPSTADDVQQMEVVLGPAAALYGPNTASGVLHMVTKSPIDHPERTLSIMGGQQDILQGSARIAHRFSDRVGVKVSGMVLSATEFPATDPDEIAERNKFIGPDSIVQPFIQDMMRALQITEEQALQRVSQIGNRSRDISRWSGEARLDWRLSDNATAIFQTGITNVGNAVELTGLGAGQVKDWRYSYYQGRFQWNRLFAQAYLNTSNAGDTYLLRTGQPIVDESTLLAGQIRHGFQPRPWQDFTYGVDIFRTNPKTKGTINGAYEDDDETTEIGAYLQSETAINRYFDLVLAGRVDDHSALPDPIFSPRAALVFKPAAGQAFRATYNRAFSTPTSLNQYLDLPTSIPNQLNDPSAAGAARLGYSVRVQGTGTSGFNLGQPGSFQMRSPFTPEGLGGPAQLLPADVTPFFPAAVQVLRLSGAPIPAPILEDLEALTPTAADIGTNFIAGSQSFPIAALDIPEIKPIREVTTTTYELGYKGVIRERFSVAADVWFTRIDDFVTPLTIMTPLLALNGPQVGQYLGPLLIPTLMNDYGMTQDQATATVTAIATGLAQVPLGVISSADVHANGAQLLATYTNVPESIDLKGIDIALQALITPSWSISAIGSLMSDDYFESEAVGIVTLNAPKRKGSLALEYRGVTNGFMGELRARYNSEFPAQSGVFTGTRCIDGQPSTAPPCVESYTLVDAMLGYSIPQLNGATIQLSVQNVFDETYRSFPGVADVGRLALVRLRYEF